MSFGQRPRSTPSVWGAILRHLGRFGGNQPMQWHRGSRRSGQRTGGGNQRMKVSKHAAIHRELVGGRWVFKT